jgi:FkbM family methyltransferase
MEIPPEILDNPERVVLTCSCRDADPIPKVAGAGEVFIENGVRVQRMHNGLKVVAGGYYGDWMTELIGRLRGHHEPQEERVFHEVMKRIPDRATMLEIGGFWLYYSLWFLLQNPNLRTAYAIEPDPNYLEIGRRNAALNRLHVHVQQGFAGGDGPATRKFQTESAGPLELPRVDIPAFLKEKGVGQLTILHCDAQGAELDVLRQCEPLFRDRTIEFAFVSTHAVQISGDPLTHQRCLALLKGLGATILAEHDVHESFSGDGLIVAYFGDDAAAGAPVSLSYNRYSKSLFRNPLYEQAMLMVENQSLRGQITEHPIRKLLRRAGLRR